MTTTDDNVMASNSKQSQLRVAPQSDGKSEFGEGRWEPLSWIAIKAEFVVAAAGRDVPRRWRLRALEHAVVAVAEHAAMALADTPIGVSMICPALVSSAMSSEGVDPSEVAAQALATIEDGTFAVIPPEWQHTVVTAATRLASGQQPRAPLPDSAE